MLMSRVVQIFVYISRAVIGGRQANVIYLLFTSVFQF